MEKNLSNARESISLISAQFQSFLSIKEWKTNESLINKKFENYSTLKKLEEHKDEIQYFFIFELIY